MPIALMLLSYVLVTALGGSEGMGILACFAALLLSAAVLVLSQRSRKRKKALQFEIVRFAEEP